MKKALLFLSLMMVIGQNAFAASCSFYIEDLTLLKTVKGYEVDHSRYEKLQLLEGNMSRRGYRASNNKEAATIVIENYDVVPYKNGNCGSGEILITNNMTGMTKGYYSKGCSRFGFIMDIQELIVYKDLIQKVPFCKDL